MNVPVSPKPIGVMPKPVVTAATGTPPQQAKPNVSPSSTAAQVVKPPPFKMESSSTAVSPWVKILAYGKPGAGKTTLLASAADVPQMRDVLFIDCEKSITAVIDNDRIKHPEFVADNRVEASTFEQIAHVHSFLTAHCKYRDANDIDKLRVLEAALRGVTPEEIIEPKKFYSVLLDSLSEADTFCTYSVLGVNQASLLQEAQGGISDVDVAGWPQFRKVNQMMQMLLRSFRDLPIHFLCTCGRAWSEDDLKKRYYALALTGQLRNQALGIFDIVGYMDQIVNVKGEEERLFYVKPTATAGRFEAKCRRSVFKQSFFKDPTMTDIMKGIGLLKQETAA